MKWLDLLEFSKKRFEFICLFFSFLLCFLELLEMFAYFCLFLFPFFLLQSFPELLLQEFLLLLSAFDELFLSVHNFLKTLEIFIDLHDSLFTLFDHLALIRHLIIIILQADSDLKIIILFFVLFFQLTAHNLRKYCIHLLSGYLSDSAFQHIATELFVVDFAKKVCLVRGEVPKSLLLDAFSNLIDYIFVSFGIGILQQDLFKYFGIA